jgi:hypothetical protein
VQYKDSTFSLLFVHDRTALNGWPSFIKIAQKFQRMNTNIKFYATGASYGPVKGLGFVHEEDMPAIYSRMHALVYLTKSAAFPLAVLESLACGTPVITRPLAIYQSLNLQLLFASTDEQAFRLIKNLYELWVNSRHKYFILANSSRQSALKYDLKRIFPLFVRMLEQAARNIKL